MKKIFVGKRWKFDGSHLEAIWKPVEATLKLNEATLKLTEAN